MPLGDIPDDSPNDIIAAAVGKGQDSVALHNQYIYGEGNTFVISTNVFTIQFTELIEESEDEPEALEESRNIDRFATYVCVGKVPELL